MGKGQCLSFPCSTCFSVCQGTILSWQISKGSHCLIRTSCVTDHYLKSPQNQFSSQSHPKNQLPLPTVPNPALSLLDSHPTTPTLQHSPQQVPVQCLSPPKRLPTNKGIQRSWEVSDSHWGVLRSVNPEGTPRLGSSIHVLKAPFLKSQRSNPSSPEEKSRRI